MKEIETEKVLPAIQKAGDATAERMRYVHGPYWSSRLDVCKVVLTITTAVLAGTISFSGSLLGPGKEALDYPLFLFAAWLMFIGSLNASLYALWHLYQLNRFHVVFNNKSPELEEAIKRIGPRETVDELVQGLNNIVVQITNSSAELLSTADKHSHNALMVQLITFGLGIIFFSIFGVMQVV